MNQPISTRKAPPADRDSGVCLVQNADTVKLIYKPVARRVTHQVLVDRARSRSELKGRFGRFEVERLFSQVWDIYCELMPNESGAPPNGSRMNMRMTCLTMALSEAFSAAGIERSHAAELISEIAWRTYDKWRLFSGMNQRVREEDIPQNDSSRPVALPVPYHFPGAYRQVDSRPRERVAQRLGTAR